MLGTKADLHSDLPGSRRASNRRIQLHALHSASLIHLLAPSSISLSLWRPLIISPALFLQMFPPLQGEHLPWTSRRWPGRSWRTPPWVRPLPQVLLPAHPGHAEEDAWAVGDCCLHVREPGWEMMGGAGARAMRVEEEQLGEVAHSTPVGQLQPV